MVCHVLLCVRNKRKLRKVGVMKDGRPSRYCHCPMDPCCGLVVIKERGRMQGRCDNKSCDQYHKVLVRTRQYNTRLNNNTTTWVVEADEDTLRKSDVAL
eukprot:2930376-Amphidinium_carterae.1